MSADTGIILIINAEVDGTQADVRIEGGVAWTVDGAAAAAH